MLIIAILGALIVVWTMYKAIVYALPFLIGWGAFRVAIHLGAGSIGTAVTATAAAVGAFLLLRFLLANVTSKAARAALGAILVLPTAIIAYNVGVDALASSEARSWARILAMAFSVGMSAIAFQRLTEVQVRDR